MATTPPVPSPGDRLLVTATDDDAADRACATLLAGDDPGGTSVVAVAARRDPERIVDAWTEHVGERPAALTVFAVDGTLRSAAAEPAAGTGDRSTLLRPVDPGELVDAVRSRLDAADGRAAVHVDALSAVGDGASVERALRRHDELAAAIDDRGAVGAFVEPAGGAVARALRPRFPAVLDVSPDRSPRGPPPGRVFDALTNRTARRSLRRLAERGGELPVADLATAVADRAGDRPAADVEVELVHAVLPKLASLDLVDHDRERGAVAPTDRTAAVRGHLALAAPHDLPDGD